jgi:hypothetical protein
LQCTVYPRLLQGKPQRKRKPKRRGGSIPGYFAKRVNVAFVAAATAASPYLQTGGSYEHISINILHSKKCFIPAQGEFGK